MLLYAEQKEILQNYTAGIFLHTGRSENKKNLMAVFSAFKCSSTLTIKFPVLSTF